MDDVDGDGAVAARGVGKSSFGLLVMVVGGDLFVVMSNRLVGLDVLLVAIHDEGKLTVKQLGGGVGGVYQRQSVSPGEVPGRRLGERRVGGVVELGGDKDDLMSVAVGGEGE